MGPGTRVVDNITEYIDSCIKDLAFLINNTPFELSIWSISGKHFSHLNPQHLRNSRLAHVGLLLFCECGINKFRHIFLLCCC